MTAQFSSISKRHAVIYTRLLLACVAWFFISNPSMFLILMAGCLISRIFIGIQNPLDLLLTEISDKIQTTVFIFSVV